MRFAITIHYDNALHFADPHLWVWYAGSAEPDEFSATGGDRYGSVFDVEVKRPVFQFKFKDGPGPAGPWESDALNRSFRPLKGAPGAAPVLREIWCRGDKAFLYPVQPRAPEATSAAAHLATLAPKPGA